MDSGKKLFLKIEDASEMFSIPINTLRKIASRRDVSVHRPFGGRRIYLSLEELKKKFEQSKV